MEIKYTLEILTKDIQEIEKLVRNLQNSPKGSTLELDLALGKLRNVYDILTIIRDDTQLERQTTRADTAPVAEPVSERVSERVSEPVVPEAPPAAPEIPKKEEPVVAKEEPVVKEEPQLPKKEKAMSTRKNAEILAEKFLAESSINENLAGNREPDMDTKLKGQPIESISRNIGINDRFLIIRELFDGDSDRFVKLIGELDGAGDLQSASQLLNSQFEQSPDHEGVSILDNLVKRRYSRN